MNSGILHFSGDFSASTIGFYRPIIHSKCRKDLIAAGYSLFKTTPAKGIRKNNTTYDLFATSLSLPNLACAGETIAQLQAKVFEVGCKEYTNKLLRISYFNQNFSTTNSLFMKTLFSTILIALILFASSAFATVRTVSNDGFTPAQFSSLQVAIDASNPGDTLYIHGSAASYGDVYIGKRLVFVGNGVNSFDGTKRSILGNTYLYSTLVGDADGTTFLGIDIGNLNVCYNPQTGLSGFKLSNVSIIRSFVRRLVAFSPTEGGGASAVLLLQCPQIADLSLNNFSSVIVQNSNFLGTASVSGGSADGAYIFNNCNFIGASEQSITGINGLGNAGIISTALFQNCIFANLYFGSLSGCIFNKCLTYLCNNDNVSSTGVILTNCLIGQNPLFIQAPNNYTDFLYYPDEATYFDPSYSNVNFQAGSPCINAGLDGKNLGPTGGSNPFNYLTQSAPQIPRMKEVTILSGQTLGTTGGTIQVQIKAKKQD